MSATEVQPLPAAHASEALSNEQIEALLQEAETRLRLKAGLEVVNTTDSGKHTMVPKLQHGLEQTPYIKEHDGVAKANSSLLVSKDQQKLADELRHVSKDLRSKKIVRYLVVTDAPFTT